MGALATMFPAIFGSYENPNLNNPNYWGIDLNSFGGGRRTTAGESVTPDSANSVSAYFACVRNVAEDVAKLPLLIYQKTDNGREKAKEHPAFKLLREAPNKEMPAQSFRETTQAQACGWHGGFAEIERDNLGNPLALWPIHSSRVTVARVKGELVYRIKAQFENGGVKYEAVDLHPMNVFAIHGVGPDGLQGTSVLRTAAESIGLALATQKFGAGFFGNGTHVGGVLTVPVGQKLTAEAVENLRSLWASHHQGAENSGKPAVMQGGVTWAKNSVDPEDAQFLETRSFQTEEICRWFRMPPHKIQHLARSTNNNIEWQGKEYFGDALGAWMIRWEEEANLKLLSKADRENGYYYKHLYNAVMIADLAGRTAHYKEMRMIGVYNANDIRELEDLNTIGPEGDAYLMQSQFTTLERIIDGTAAAGATQLDSPSDPEPPEPKKPEPKEEPDAAKAMGAVFADIAGRCVAREIKAIESLKKDKMTPQAFGEWAKTFYVGHADYLTDNYNAACESLSALVKRRMPYVACKQLAREYCKRHAAEIQAVFAAGLLADTFELWQHNQMDLATELMNVIKESE